MPSRLLREGILTSDRVDLLDNAAEVFYRRLMSKVDDHGLYDARPSILRSSLYPLRVDRVREADIARWIAACEKAGVIALYQHDGKPYLQMLDTRWQARSEPKYPLPPANSCKQENTPVPVFGVGVGVGVAYSGDPGGSGFEDFWKSYPRKSGKDAARRAFARRKPDKDLLQRMLSAISEQLKTDAWQKDGGKYIPNPEKWLEDGHWENQATVIATEPKGPDPEVERVKRESALAVPPPPFIRAQIAAITNKGAFCEP